MTLPNLSKYDHFHSVLRGGPIQAAIKSTEKALSNLRTSQLYLEEHDIQQLVGEQLKKGDLLFITDDIYILEKSGKYSSSYTPIDHSTYKRSMHKWVRLSGTPRFDKNWNSLVKFVRVNSKMKTDNLRLELNRYKYYLVTRP